MPTVIEKRVSPDALERERDHVERERQRGDRCNCGIEREDVG
jgi:hypothetical protein